MKYEMKKHKKKPLKLY